MAWETTPAKAHRRSGPADHEPFIELLKFIHIHTVPGLTYEAFLHSVGTARARRPIVFPVTTLKTPTTGEASTGQKQQV